MEPHKPERIEEILCLVTIGPDLRDNERLQVRNLIHSFADVFALSVHKVQPVKDAVYKLDITP